MPDEEIVTRVRAGATALFEVLMRRHNQKLYRAVRGVLRQEADVEEVMQQAYLAAFTHLGDFAAQAKFSTWLLRIGINEALARLRRNGRVTLFRDGDDEKGAHPMDRRPSPEDKLASRELAGLLEHCIDDLPAEYRQVLMLRLVEGLSTEATAEVLELTTDATKQRLHRARAMVQRSIDDALGTHASELFEFHASRCDRVVAAVLAALASAGQPGARQPE
jgi:RNA polymerase sigma-70 factor (ECF subfamily)